MRIQTCTAEPFHMLFERICKKHLLTEKACLFFCYCECQSWLVDHTQFWRDTFSLSLFPWQATYSFSEGLLKHLLARWKELRHKLPLKICTSTYTWLARVYGVQVDEVFQVPDPVLVTSSCELCPLCVLSPVRMVYMSVKKVRTPSLPFSYGCGVAAAGPDALLILQSPQ